MLHHRHPSLTRSLLTFGLIGPAVGGLVAFVLVLVTIVLPDLWADPGNTFGHNRVADLFATMALAALFSYPIGLVPALASGIAYHFCAQRLPGHRVGASVLICLTGVLVMAAMRSMWMPVAPWVLLPIAGVSAVVVSLYAFRSHASRVA